MKLKESLQSVFIIKIMIIVKATKIRKVHCNITQWIYSTKFTGLDKIRKIT